MRHLKDGLDADAGCAGDRSSRAAFLGSVHDGRGVAIGAATSSLVASKKEIERVTSPPATGELSASLLPSADYWHHVNKLERLSSSSTEYRKLLDELHESLRNAEPGWVAPTPCAISSIGDERDATSNVKPEQKFVDLDTSRPLCARPPKPIAHTFGCGGPPPYTRPPKPSVLHRHCGICPLYLDEGDPVRESYVRESYRQVPSSKRFS